MIQSDVREKGKQAMFSTEDNSRKKKKLKNIVRILKPDG
jgi:hypothetical protein